MSAQDTCKLEKGRGALIWVTERHGDNREMCETQFSSVDCPDIDRQEDYKEMCERQLRSAHCPDTDRQANNGETQLSLAQLIVLIQISCQKRSADSSVRQAWGVDMADFPDGDCRFGLVCLSATTVAKRSCLHWSLPYATASKSEKKWSHIAGGHIKQVLLL